MTKKQCRQEHKYVKVKTITTADQTFQYFVFNILKLFLLILVELILKARIFF